MAQKKSISKWTWLVSAIAIVSGLLGCGGAQQPELPPCQVTYKELLDMNDDEICDSGSLTRFEIQVEKWRNECPKYVPTPYGRRISNKFAKAQICVENKGNTEMQRKACDARLEEVINGLNCLGEECSPYLVDLEKMAKECNLPAFEGAYTEKLKKLTAQMTERKQEEKRLRAIGQLIMLCDQFVEVTSEDDAKGIISDVLDAVSVTPPMSETPPPGSEVDNYRKGAIESCSHALLLSVEVITTAVSKRLESKAVKKSKKKFKQHLGTLTELFVRLESVNSATLFPGADTLLRETIRTFDPKAVPEKPADPAPAPEPEMKSTPPGPKTDLTASKEKKPEPKPEKEKKETAKQAAPLPETKSPPKDEKKEPAKPESANASTPATDDKSAQKETQAPIVAKTPDLPAERGQWKDRDLLKKNIGRCKFLVEKMTQFSRKVREYTKKKNPKKLAAYEGKLRAEQQKMADLNAELNQVFKTTKIPEPDKKKLKKQITKAGCSPE